jgi:O-antigen/teichoic acid export membrane protein
VPRTSSSRKRKTTRRFKAHFVPASMPSKPLPAITIQPTPALTPILPEIEMSASSVDARDTTSSKAEQEPAPEDIPTHVLQAIQPQFKSLLFTSRLKAGPPTQILAVYERPQKPRWDLTDTGIDEHPEFARQSTIPMMVLISIAKQQRQEVPAMQTEISGIASNATISGLGNIAGYIIKSGSSFLMQHGLGAAGFGLYSLSFSVISFVASLFTFGLDDAMVRYTAIYSSKNQANQVRSLTVFCTALAGILGLLGAFGVIYLAPLLATHITHHPEATPFLQLMAPIIPLSCMQVIWMGGLQGFKEFKKRILAQRVIIPLIVVLLLIITFIFYPDNITAVIIVTIISTLLSTLANLYFLFSRVSRLQPGCGQYEAREWLSFSTPNFLTNVVDIALDAIDTLLLGYFGIGKVGIGQYSAAIKISGFISMPLASLNTIFSPTIAELHSKGEYRKLEAMFKVITQWAITFSLPIFCTASLFSTSLLEILSGRDFIDAWPLLVVFGMAGMANASTGSVGLMLLMTGHQKLSFLNSLAAIIINITLGILLTPRYGAMGAAISTGLATTTVNMMRLLQVRLTLKIQPYRKETLKPLAAGLCSSSITGLLLYLLHRSGWSLTIAHIHIPLALSLIPVFLASYIGVLMLFGATPEDKIVLHKIKSKLRDGRGKQSTKDRREEYLSHG